ncbi:hypothetical protein HDU98_007132 [Podochytrium sp. JEL0797]|nr:hypothetical protein HDU98_007132 [Podochytrium sp. JEL0797]
MFETQAKEEEKQEKEEVYGKLSSMKVENEALEERVDELEAQLFNEQQDLESMEAERDAYRSETEEHQPKEKLQMAEKRITLLCETVEKVKESEALWADRAAVLEGKVIELRAEQCSSLPEHRVLKRRCLP